ncbi:hypothetical protein [Aurantimonas coralicida]|uniref:hypothetical protein n=1 Tax=Aurantimonas coralicida TaxID=182270 RepID=UPI0023905745|nr:hypothetical protein [Aurantimonas coralicida]MDE0921496.1 hypothetical protein [Aurantimonas coralicida]
MAKQSKALVKEAEALGIEVDGRWGDETLQEQIDEARDAAAARQTEAEERARQDAQALEGEAGGEGSDDSGPDAGPGGVDAGLHSAETPSAGQEEPASATDESATVHEMGAVAGSADHGGAAAETDGDAEEHEGAGSAVLSGIDAGSADDEGKQEVNADGAPHEGPNAAGDGAASAADGAAGEAAAVEVGAASLLSPSDTPPAGVTAGEWDELTADPYKTLQEALDLATGAPSAAYEAATAVYEALTPATEPGGDRWFCSDDTDALDANVALVLVAVPFVRTWPEAPIEALYGHTAKSAPALGLSKPWTALDRPAQAAWETFHDVLVKVDRMKRADAAALAATQADTRPRFTVAHDETTLEEVDEPGALSELGRMAAARL